MFGSGKGLLFAPEAVAARLSPEIEACLHPFEKHVGIHSALTSFSLKATLSLGAFGDTRDTVQVTPP